MPSGFDPFRLKIAAEMGSAEALKQAVKAKMGISILSKRAVASELEQGSLITASLDNLQMKRYFYLVQKTYSQLNPTAHLFLNFVRQKAKS